MLREKENKIRVLETPRLSREIREDLDECVYGSEDSTLSKCHFLPSRDIATTLVVFSVELYRLSPKFV